MTLDELLRSARSRSAQALREHGEARATAQEARRAAEHARRPYREDPDYIRAYARQIELEGAAETAATVVRDLERAQAEDEEYDRLSSIRIPTRAGRELDQERATMTTSNTTARLREEYNVERDRTGERSYFRDLFQATQGGDVNARARIEQFQAEERAVSSSGFAGLVVPQYLVDQAALIARTGRPVAESVQHLPIPDQGATFQVPQGTTGASAAVQASENSAVSSTDEVWGNIAVPVATIAGQQDVSRQSLERGTPGLDSLVYQDLIGAYFAAQEAQVLSGSGSSGQMLGILNTSGVNQATAFTAAVTATTFQTKVAGQVSAVASNRLQSPTHIAMHPRRWAWLLSQTDSSGRPLVTAELNGPTNAVSVGDGAHAYGVTDSYFQGLRVVVSAQLPTAVGTGPEDQVIVYRASDLLLWQDGDGTPRELRFEQTLGGSLTVKLVAYGYSAFTAARFPKAVGVVGGNAAAGFGLVAPTF